MSIIVFLKGVALNRLSLIAFFLVCQMTFVGCDSGPGDPDAPIDDPPSTEAGDLGTEVVPVGDGTGV